MNQKKKKPPSSPQQIRLHSEDDIAMAKIAVPETNRLMTIFTKGCNVQLQGPVKELQEFKKRIKDKDNRHTFLEAPKRLFAFNPALEEVTVLPADVGVIIIADPAKAPPRQGRIAVPGGAVPKKQEN